MSIHTCSYYCDRPECIRAQRDELRQKLEQAEKQEPVAWLVDGEIRVRLDMAGKLYYSETNVYTAPVHASDISQERVDETAKDRHEPIKLRRGNLLRCIETDELCTVWATSTSGKTLVHWGGNDFTEYTAEQIGELFWLEPESSDVEIAAEQSDNYASFLAGVRFARVNLPAPPKREHELAGTIPISNGGVATRTPSSFISPPKREWVSIPDWEIHEMYNEPTSDSEMIAFAREFEAKLKEKNT